MRKFIVKVKTLLAQSSLVTRAAVVVRDQANTIVRLRLSDSPFVAESGERWLLNVIGPSCTTFLDVGGNKGVWTELLLSSGGPPKKGIIFEPSTSALAVLQSKFADRRNEVTILPVAVSDHEGTAIFHEEPDAGGTSSLVAGFSKPTAKPRTVRVVSVDGALAEHGMSRIDVMKVDTEGLDLLVLRGARSLINEQRVGLLQFEYNQMWLGSGSTLRAAVELLQAARMEVFLLNSRGLYTPDFPRYGEFLGQSNFIAVSPEWRSRLAPHVRGVI